MGKGKKKFDSKNSSKFVVLHRSQLDAEYGNEGASPFVLFPANKQGETTQNALFGEQSLATKPPHRRDHVNSFGLPNDGYDYEQHLRTTGNGVFISASGEVRKDAPAIPASVFASQEEDNSRMLESITISADCMDADLKQALFDGSEEYEELDDNFMEQVAEEPSGSRNENQFDFDAHIAKLLAASERTIARPEIEESVDEETIPAFDPKFEELLDGYDSEEIGAPELEDPVGAVEENELEGILDEYLESSRKSQLKVPKRKIRVEVREDLVEEEPKEDELETSTTAHIEQQLDRYMSDYFPTSSQPAWDCETIVSTYSNLDNHPQKIVEGRRKPKQNKVILSSKTGIPIGVLPTTSARTKQHTPSLSETMPGSRAKGETAEEKKMRKNAVKAQKKERRQEKKTRKKEHNDRASHPQSLENIPVFRYTGN